MAIKTCTQYDSVARCGDDTCRIIGTKVKGKEIKTCAWKGDPDSGSCLQCPEEDYKDTWYGNTKMQTDNPCDYEVTERIDTTGHTLTPTGGGINPFYRPVGH